MLPIIKLTDRKKVNLKKLPIIFSNFLNLFDVPFTLPNESQKKIVLKHPHNKLILIN